MRKKLVRWTIQSKNNAIQMLRDGAKIETVATIFNMSRPSIRSLKYGIIKVTAGGVKCEICGKNFKQITGKHLKNHNIFIEEYKKKFPNSKTCTDERTAIYKSFKNTNKGKTYEAIYGKDEAIKKRQKISQKQTGRKCPLMAGTGITGTRKDTNTFARSTYEANIDRVFIYEGKKYIGEFSKQNPRYTLVDKDGKVTTYQPDRIDLDGLFEKNALIEIKGYMYAEDWEKMKLFRKQYADKKLIIVCPSKDYCDIDYTEIEEKYRAKIPLWETAEQNFKTRPDLYKLNYIEPERMKYLRETYPQQMHYNIKNNHEKFIAKHCLDYIKIRMGKETHKNTYIDTVKLIAISNRRNGAYRTSSGKYNYELWEIETEQKKKFYITNIFKTVLFYCYQEHELIELIKFFENNNNPLLRCGIKEELRHSYIDESLWQNSDAKQKDILQLISNKFIHKGIKKTVTGLKLLESSITKMSSTNNREKWGIFTNNHTDNYGYILSNFNGTTKEYVLKEI